MAEVLLTHGYFLYEDEKEQQIMKPYPPLGILYISAYLEQQGIDNEVFDTTFSSKKALQEYLLKERPTYLAIYINLMTKLNVLELIQFVKNTSQLQHTKVILGGPDVRYNAENLLQAGADYLVIGEGEQTAFELIGSLQKEQSIEAIEGIAYRNTEGKIMMNKERQKLKNIDELPSPNRHKIDLQLYFDTWKKYHGQSAMTVSTMRGCPYTCKWCSRGVYGLSYRRRSPQKVVEELKYIQKTYQPDTLWFVDDVFTVSHKWLREFQEELEKQQVMIPFECISRADRMNEEVIQILKKAGCFRVWIGAESGSQKIIDLMDRRVDVQQVRQMIQQTQAVGIEAGTFIMLGYPGETETDIEETIEHLKISNPDYYTVTLAYPIKGTELYEEVEHSSTAQELDWQKTTDREIQFMRQYNKTYYQYALKRLHAEVHYHKLKIKKEHWSIGAAKLKTKAIVYKVAMWWNRSFKKNLQSV